MKNYLGQVIVPLGTLFEKYENLAKEKEKREEKVSKDDTMSREWSYSNL